MVTVNYRFQQNLTSDHVGKIGVAYRFREALMNDLSARLHGYGARPGFIAFRPKRYCYGTIKRMMNSQPLA